jgi:parallel beta-helix repeat protein
MFGRKRGKTMRRTLGPMFTLVLTLSLVVAGGGRAAASSTIWVNDDKLTLPGPRSCNNPDFQQIQPAVNAAGPGDQINVCPGNYPEQVSITGPGKNNIKLRSTSVWQAVIKAPLVMDAVGAIVRVSGATNVTILAFVITGPTQGSPLNNGVRVDSNGSANILGNHITKIRDEPLMGSQHGVAIQVGRFAEATNGSAKIIGNVIDEYQKNGITISNSMSSGEVAYNRITGAGPTPTIAQNGIQVSSGATGIVRHNFVSKNIYSPGEPQSTGVLLYLPGVVLVDRNTLTGNDVGVYDFIADPGTGTITNNLSRASTLDGIIVQLASEQRVQGNKLSQNSGPGIGLYNGDKNAIKYNWVDRNKDSGILLDSDLDTPLGSNNNDVRGNFVTFNGSNPSGDTTDGIRVNAPSTGNLIEDNRLKHNVTHDCHDWAAPTVSGNTWKDNEAQTSSPPDICADDEDADRGHHDEDYGWDRNHSWNAEYDAADLDFTAAYATVDIDGLLQLLPQLLVSTGHHAALPSN